MSKRLPKPATPLAKAQADLLKGWRKDHPKFDDDVIAFGRDVAIYNAGWLAGDTHRKNKRKTR